MTWIVQNKQTWLEWAAMKVLKVGPIPKHIALIMDGNRRFAVKNQKELIKGHEDGFRKLTEILSWCRDLGINEVTAYAFSIANFKRPKKEVSDLMNLATNVFKDLLKEIEDIKTNGICVRVIGNISLLPVEIQKLIADAVLTTRHNTDAYLNLAISYTSQEEITTSLNKLNLGVKEGQLLKTDINESMLEKCLYTQGSKDPDLLIRTSGEIRLSDFLLWQSSFSCLFFTKVLWPEITVWHIFGAVFYYQRHYHNLQKEKQHAGWLRAQSEEQSDLDCCRMIHGDKVTQDILSQYSKDRKLRCENFLTSQESARIENLYTILDS